MNVEYVSVSSYRNPPLTIFLFIRGWRRVANTQFVTSSAIAAAAAGSQVTRESTNVKAASSTEISSVPVCTYVF